MAMASETARGRMAPGDNQSRSPQLPSHVPPELVIETNYLAPNTREDPFSVTEGVLEKLPPIFYSITASQARFPGAWVVTRYDDIRGVYQNAELYSTYGIADFQFLVGETWPMIPLSIDPPDHNKYRAMLNPWFSPKAVDDLTPKITATINGLIDKFIGKGECDAAYDFGRLYPVMVFLDLMGFPHAKIEDFLSWEYGILHSGFNLEKVQWGVRSALAYLREFVAETKKSPGDNLVSHIVNAKIAG